MERPLPEVMVSQDEMLRRRGTFDPSGDNSVVARAFQDHLYQIEVWFKVTQRGGRECSTTVYYAHPRKRQRALEVLAGSPDVEAMARQVDETLYRQRRKSLGQSGCANAP